MVLPDGVISLCILLNIKVCPLVLGDPLTAGELFVGIYSAPGCVCPTGAGQLGDGHPAVAGLSCENPDLCFDLGGYH